MFAGHVDYERLAQGAHYISWPNLDSFEVEAGRSDGAPGVLKTDLESSKAIAGILLEAMPKLLKHGGENDPTGRGEDRVTVSCVLSDAVNERRPRRN